MQWASHSPLLFWWKRFRKFSYLFLKIFLIFPNMVFGKIWENSWENLGKIGEDGKKFHQNCPCPFSCIRFMCKTHTQSNLLTSTDNQSNKNPVFESRRKNISISENTLGNFMVHCAWHCISGNCSLKFGYITTKCVSQNDGMCHAIHNCRCW